MRYPALSALVLCAGTVKAHFQLQYPLPRGGFVSENEPTFCGGYTEVTTNRSTFPLSDGFFRIKQGHEHWSGAVLVSTDEDPNNFGDFNGTDGQQFARYWATADVAGELCIPLDLSRTNISGVDDGANVTIQIMISGGDGNLYQCADLTLSSNYTIPQEIKDTCVNSTSESSSSPAPTGSGALGLTQQISGYTALLFALGGSALAML